jgi:hypothetical protein
MTAEQGSKIRWRRIFLLLKIPVTNSSPNQVSISSLSAKISGVYSAIIFPQIPQD